MQKPRSGQPGNEQKAPNSHLAHVPTEQTIKEGGGTTHINVDISSYCKFCFAEFWLYLHIKSVRPSATQQDI